MPSLNDSPIVIKYTTYLIIRRPVGSTDQAVSSSEFHEYSWNELEITFFEYFLCGPIGHSVPMASSGV